MSKPAGHVTYFTENYRKQIIRGIGETLYVLNHPQDPDPRRATETELKLIDGVVSDLALLNKYPPHHRVTREKGY